MKRFVVLSLVAIMSVLMAGVLCACGSSATKSAASYTSGEFQEVGDTVYYAGFGYVPSTVAEIEDYEKLPVESSNFLVYDNKVYYTASPLGTAGDEPVELHACDLDGSNDAVVVDDALPQGTFYIVDGTLVYEHLLSSENATEEQLENFYCEMDCWYALDLGTEGAEPERLMCEDANIAVVAASDDLIYYAQRDNETGMETAGLFSMKTDMTEQTVVGDTNVDLNYCRVDADGGLVCLTEGDAAVQYYQDGELKQSFDIDYDKTIVEDSANLTLVGSTLYAANEEGVVYQYDCTTGEKTELQVDMPADAYYCYVRYNDGTNVVFECGIPEDEGMSNTVLLTQPLDYDKASECGRWFES